MTEFNYGWRRSSVVRPSLVGVLYLTCARSTVDRWPLCG